MNCSGPVVAYIIPRQRSLTLHNILPKSGVKSKPGVKMVRWENSWGIYFNPEKHEILRNN